MFKRISDERIGAIIKSVSPDNFPSLAVPRSELAELVRIYCLFHAVIEQHPVKEQSKYPYGLEALDPPLKESVMSVKQYTFGEVLKILENMGHDTQCGACMSVAFTGASATSEHTCKVKVEHDDTEPLFTLRGQDWIAPEIIREWAFRSLKLGSPIDKVDGARRIADEMENWQIANDKRKVAD